MNINVQIMLGTDEYAADLAGNSTEIAEKILAAVGGDEAKDTVSVAINDHGSAGANAMPPAPSVTRESSAE